VGDQTRIWTLIDPALISLQGYGDDAPTEMGKLVLN
jgi:hypothetical protein